MLNGVSGRISVISQRNTVQTVRQRATKASLRAGGGSEALSQARRNSSVHFEIGRCTPRGCQTSLPLTRRNYEFPLLTCSPLRCEHRPQRTRRFTVACREIRRNRRSLQRLSPLQVARHIARGPFPRRQSIVTAR